MAMMQTSPPEPSTRRNAPWLVGIALILIGGALVVAWPYLALVSVTPKAGRPDLTALMLAQAGVAPENAGKPNAAADRFTHVLNLVFDAHSQALGTRVQREFTPKWGIAFDADATIDPRQMSVFTAAEALGLFTTLDELAADPAVYLPVPGGTSPLAYGYAQLDQNAPIRQLSRMLAVRFADACRRGDAQAARAAFEQSLGLARAAAHRPLASSRITALAVLANITEQAGRRLERGDLPPAILEALDAELDADRFPLWTYVLETERQYAHAMIASMFGRTIVRAADAGSNIVAFDQILDLYSDAIESATPIAGLQAAEVRAAQIAAPFQAVKAAIPALPQLYRTESKVLGRVALLRARVAVERFRRDTGRLPATLAELVPTYLSASPSDDQGPIPYVVTDAAVTQMGTGFTLGRPSEADATGPRPLPSAR